MGIPLAIVNNRFELVCICSIYLLPRGRRLNYFFVAGVDKLSNLSNTDVDSSKTIKNRTLDNTKKKIDQKQELKPYFVQKIRTIVGCDYVTDAKNKIACYNYITF